MEKILIDLKKLNKKLNYIFKTYGVSEVIKKKVYEAVEKSTIQPTIDPMKWEWISVKDRLPEEKVKVLVVLGSNIRGKRICIDQRISGNWRGLGCLVTHWMPLPEPPERDGE